MNNRILLVSSDSGLIRIVKAALDAAASLLQIDKLQDDGTHLQDHFQPNAIIVDSDAHSGVKTAFERIADVKRQFPKVPIIAIGNEMSAQLVLAALRAGAADFIDREASAEQLQLSIQCCLANGGDAHRAGRSRIAAVLSALPSEQDQDFALNLAVRAAKRSPKEMTLYIDLSLPASQAGVALGLDLKFGVGDALRELARLDSALLESALAREPRSGLYVMALAGDFGSDDIVLETKSFAALLQVLQSIFDTIVIAFGPFSRQRALLEMVQPAARYFLCCNQRFSSIKGASELLRRLAESGIADSTDIVVHELAPRQIPAPADIRKVLRIPGSIDIGGSWDQLAEHFNGADPWALDETSRYGRALDVCLQHMGVAVQASGDIGVRLRGWLRHAAGDRAQ